MSLTSHSDDDHADRVAETYAQNDPFPEIYPALLSSAEIEDYVWVTRMVDPFYPESLKSASYEVRAAGRFIFWDENGDRHDTIVSPGDKCELRANSISYIQVEPTFRLPNYMAIRFNLRITHVHRGLLLGTGPLVDPGFHGKLLIPLHNLTSTKYELDTAEALIWIEFTKTTYKQDPLADNPSRRGIFRPFPTSKRHLTPDTYLYKANGGHPIRSSIPLVITEASRQAAESREIAKQASETSKSSASDARNIRNIFFGVGFIALMGLLVAITSMFLQVKNVIQGASNLTNTVQQSFASEGKRISEKLDKLERDSDALQREFDATKRQSAFDERNQAERLELLSKQIAQMEAKIEQLNREIELLRTPPANR